MNYQDSTQSQHYTQSRIIVSVAEHQPSGNPQNCFTSHHIYDLYSCGTIRKCNKCSNFITPGDSQYFLGFWKTTGGKLKFDQMPVLIFEVQRYKLSNEIMHKIIFLITHRSRFMTVAMGGLSTGLKPCGPEEKIDNNRIQSV